MKLNLQPYDPSGDLRGRAAAALNTLTGSWAASPAPIIATDARDDAEERSRAAARKWRATAGGKACQQKRQADGLGAASSRKWRERQAAIREAKRGL